MWRNSLGQYSVVETFIPAWYNTKQNKFKPLVIRRIDCEIKETQTTESVCGVSHEAESRIAQENQQTTASEIKQA